MPRLPADPAEAEWYVDVPEVIGSYEITQAERVPGGVIFEAASSCGLFDDAGFGWFPNGPDASALNSGSFESPTFSHIRGPWRTWCASW